MSGVTDHYAWNDQHALSLARAIVSRINQKTVLPVSSSAGVSEPPVFPAHEMYGIVGTNLRRSYDIREVAVYLIGQLFKYNTIC